MVKVKVSEGWLEGEQLQLQTEDGQYYSFKGIPYAAPPLGKLRFKAPQPMKPWEGVRSAKEFGSANIHFDLFSGQRVGTEDCLFLNVYSPDLNPKKPLPVMVFIHGGGFFSGSSDEYGPDLLVRKDVILVTINYRLGAFGFLCLDVEDIPGNAGMKDQVAALKWIKNNIQIFGGDSENITIFGESAGGASCSYHLVSPMSKGLFNKAIIQSGTFTSWWPQSFEPRERALKLAKKLGLFSEDDQKLVEFFQTVEAEKLIGLQLPVTLGKKLYDLSFAVTNEKQFGNNERFYFGDPIEVLKKGIHDDVKVMTGYTKDEGIMAFALNIPFESYLAEANEFKEFFVPRPIQIHCSIIDQLEVGRKIKEFYFKDDTIASLENFDKLLRYLNWEVFVHGGLLLPKLISDKSTVYVYKFTCRSERNVFAPMIGFDKIIGDKPLVSHADDLFYIFSSSAPELAINKNAESFTLINKVTTIWSNFAKYGDPTPDNSLGVKWAPYNVQHKRYLDIGNQLVPGTEPDREDEVFWDDIYRQYLPHYVA